MEKQEKFYRMCAEHPEFVQEWEFSKKEAR